MGAISLAERFGLMPILNGNEVEWISDSHQVIHHLIEDIAQARKHVHMLFFIFRNDETGKQVTESLKKAAQRGVKCRLLLDSVGSWKMLHSLRHELEQAGVEVYDALPGKIWPHSKNSKNEPGIFIIHRKGVITSIVKKI